ncbi:TetR family transcriptional regulator [Amycolatopsis halotolerans]|uniref:TetR family transcriptional regulator n=1 Tax=Amycolatopsis halotolerans TaxID=330083 RepID=A0ABV7QW82_9PSEU
MDEEHAPDTRSRILEVAADLFLRQGYIETSLSQIARRLGLTKAAVLYHFPAKDTILTELAEPMLAELEGVLDAAEEMEPESARWAVVEGILDASFGHLRVLAIANAAWVARDPVYRRVVAINNRASRIIAGPGAGLRERVRASATLALLARPALFHQEDPPQDVRREALDAAARLLCDIGDSAVPSPVLPHSRTDRRRVMTADRMAAARRLQAAGTHTVADIARMVGVSRATAYRYLTSDPAEPRRSST